MTAPATYQCTLCPKRFTRAFNLRNHLRTHTDERPFVCTVCGKAFARQNDRRSHEQLHTGEQKFVCKGYLETGSPWGCSRRFNRASNLGRHFRSDAGRVCIRPLLDEEAAKRFATLQRTVGEKRTPTLEGESNAAWPQLPRPNAELRAATTLTSIARTSETESSPYVKSVAQPAQSDISHPTLSAFSPGALSILEWCSNEHSYRPLLGPPPETQHASNNGGAKSESVLALRGKILILERILTDKGFDVEAEIKSDLLKWLLMSRG